MILNGSHLVLATNQVESIALFFEKVFELSPHFSNKKFVEFLLPGKYRIAFFKPTGKTKEFFKAESGREGVSYGVTVKDVEKVYQNALSLNAKVSGPPKEHPWGEKSFLLIDPDGNRWEVTHSPTFEGSLVNRS